MAVVRVWWSQPSQDRKRVYPATRPPAPWRNRLQEMRKRGWEAPVAARESGMVMARAAGWPVKGPELRRAARDGALIQMRAMGRRLTREQAAPALERMGSLPSRERLYREEAPSRFRASARTRMSHSFPAA